MPYIHTVQVHNRRAPDVILPLVWAEAPFRSVLDVGCGLGTWLAAAAALGVTDLVGVELEPVDRSMLAVSPDLITRLDLSRPFLLDRKFDLAICLEVAEHLPEVAADGLIESLISHSDRILFSAAVPGQGGQDHLNEQWPSYWQEKFARHGFAFRDTLRPLIWENPEVEWWYRQNILVAQRAAPLDRRAVQPVIHPAMFEAATQGFERQTATILRGGLGVRTSLSVLSRSIRDSFRRRFAGPSAQE